MIFLHLFDSSEIAAGHLTRFLRYQACGQGIALGQFPVSKDFIVHLSIELPFPEQGEQTSHWQAQLHDSASKNRATRAVALSQFATSMPSCFDPALVSEYTFTLRFVSEIPHWVRIQSCCSRRMRAG